ncbi:protein P21-like [Dendrobium catenatum]|uniref:Protein P21 n=1 Tax=Dendrobium catenatum TaxID=906689 RepID=A0A2I0VD06_9ASPA|nr:protein P21-like [Dendrobium catenatum]PKU61292.1 Protein P21 [Dendrobium catenatum]
MAAISFVLLPLAFLTLLTPHKAATFTIVNNCSDTLWPAAVPYGGGIHLNSGQTWTFEVPSGTTVGRVWARTGCSFDDSGNGHCETGDCGGKLSCAAYGSPPNTLAEFALNEFSNLDLFDISLVDGYNVGINFSPATASGSCQGQQCAADFVRQCPAALKAPGGCNNPCTVFKTDEYCCYSGSCVPTDYSRFFKNLCPDAYSFPKDDQTDTYSCPAGTDYRVTFCP